MKTLIVAAAAALAAGCFGGLKNESVAPRIYRVEAPAFEAGAALPADLSVVVERTAPGLEGDGIAGRWPGSRLDYIAGARWAGDLARMLQSALVESFQDTGRLRSVQGDAGRFGATHTLVVEVRRFEADYTAGPLPVAQVELAVTLGRNANRQVIASFTATASEGAAANRQTSLVAALDVAFARAAAELAARSFAAIAADPGPAQASANIGP
jgi:cholesterol transport system auxiliary component